MPEETTMTTTCTTCADGLSHCHATLVLHADGTVDCEEVARCDAEELAHDWAVPCRDLGCGCTGDEADLDLGVARAA
jgi:hypothetical protein